METACIILCAVSSFRRSCMEPEPAALYGAGGRSGGEVKRHMIRIGKIIAQRFRV